MPDLFAELESRGFVQQTTPELRVHLAGGRRTVYCGFDPTAPSLQLGNLMPVMLLRHFQLGGHRPLVLMGGGTGLIGDPSGKPSERPLLSKEQIRDNLHRQRDQMGRLLDFDTKETRPLVLDNAEWLVQQRLVDFLRDVGKHFTVNLMLQKESVQGRLDAGISYTEFSYMLLQAYDFLHLFRKEQCTIQVGGSDQWGNITAGIELIRRVEGGEAHGFVAPLVTTASGAKFGKSEAGAIWLDPQLSEAARSAIVASEILFGDFDPRRADARVFDTLAVEIPTTPTPANGLTLVDAVVRAGLAKSKSEARRSIEQGGIYVNQERAQDVERRIEPADWLADRNVLLRKGKKDYALLRLSS